MYLLQLSVRILFCVKVSRIDYVDTLSYLIKIITHVSVSLYTIKNIIWLLFRVNTWILIVLP